MVCRLDLASGSPLQNPWCRLCQQFAFDICSIFWKWNWLKIKCLTILFHILLPFKVLNFLLSRFLNHLNDHFLFRLPLRFWQGIITHPNYIFDVRQSQCVEASLRVVSQAFFDAFSKSEHKLGKVRKGWQVIGQDVSCSLKDFVTNV